MAPFSFSTHPDRYTHWKLTVDGELARLTMSVQDDAPFKPGYTLKLNSYDLGVDIELADAVQRLRFEHPDVKAVIIGADKERVFCAGANIPMLASSSHPFKVNFCKYTNETRLAIEDASQASFQKYLAACNGTTAGGGYELALATDEILLLDDGSSVVSLPEVPLLGVLPGTGGLTRLVDKRKVRRDHADVFSTLAEGIKGKRAVEWRLVDAVVPRSLWNDTVVERAHKLAASARAEFPERQGRGVLLCSVDPKIDSTAQTDTLTYQYVTLTIQRAPRTAELVLHAPTAGPPEGPAAILAQGSAFWPLRAFRELDDAILRLRFHYEEVGVVVIRTQGDAQQVLAMDQALHTHRAHWFVREVLLQMSRTLRRLDATARSLFAIVDLGSCFAGSLLELALAADRTYMLDEENGQVTLQASPLNGGAFPMAHGLTRLQIRHLHVPARAAAVLEQASLEPLAAARALASGLVTITADDIDFPDEVRLAIEERASLSPDALTGMEQNLRFAGPESLGTKIFGRLSAWQNWIFIRDNATGDKGALSLYGKPERPQFDWRRT